MTIKFIEESCIIIVFIQFLSACLVLFFLFFKKEKYQFILIITKILSFFRHLGQWPGQ